MGGRGSSSTRNTGYTRLDSEQESESFFYDSSERWKSSLSNREETTINEYTMYNNKVVNEFLRSGKVDESFGKEDLQKQVDAIQSALNRYELEENVVLYRAGNSEQIDKEFASFVSTSTSRKLAESYLSSSKGSDTLYIIQASKGKGKGAYVSSVSEVPEEQEFLLNRGLKPKVLNRDIKEIMGQKIKVITVRI